MSRVVLTTLNAKYIHSSLALRYLRAVAEPSHEVVLKEFTIHDPVEWMAGVLFELSPEVIGFSCYIWNIEETSKLLSVLRKVLPSTLFVLGGPEVSYDSRFHMQRMPEVDVIVSGEGEEAFCELLSVHAAGGDLSGVRGLYLRDGRYTGTREKVDLTRVPTPYPEDHMDELDRRIVYFEASRGCPFSCQFCLSSIESGVRYFPVEHVLQELTKLIAAGVRQIKFVDRTFNLRKDYAIRIFSHVIENPGNTTFHFEITADILKSDVVSWLCEHAPPGLFRFEIGVQSTNDLTNDIIQRRQDFEKLSHTVRTIRAAGRIVQHLDLIAGLPEEDYATFRTTFNDVYALRPEELQLGFLKMLRGTGLRNMADRYGYVYMDRAPYEVLYNERMPYGDVIRLKRLEDILEKYYNAGRFPHTVEYLTAEVFDTPFDFFQKFGDFWHLNGWSRIGHQPLDLVRRLQQFLASSGSEDDVGTALLRADYLLREKLRPRTIWWHSVVDDVTARRFLTQILHTNTEVGQVRPRDLDELGKRVVFDSVPLAAYTRMGPAQDVIQYGVEKGDRVTIAYIYPKDNGYPVVVALDEVSTNREWAMETAR